MFTSKRQICLALAFGSMLVPCTSRAQTKKFSGAQFRAEVLERPALELVRPTKTTQTLLPELRVKVLIPGGASLSPDLKELFVLAGVRRRPLGPEQFFLKDTTRDTIRTILDAEAVRVIELGRPNQIHPVDHVRFDLTRRVPFNFDARRSHFVPEFEGTFHNDQGKSITAAVFDGGVVRQTHVEFANNRISVLDTGSVQEAHATHVAGTMAAKGVNQAARGMAPALSIQSFDWNDDLAKLESLATEVQVTNHSYGPSTGWDYRPGIGWLWWGDVTLSDVEDASFGKYSIENQILDDTLFRHSQLLTVVAAGNDRNDLPSIQPVSHYVRGPDPATGEQVWFLSAAIRNPDGFDNGGLDTIAGLGLSKNTLCVGAINDLFMDGAPIPGATIQSTRFSSWGPTDDGRVKPDVVANGETLLSPTVPPPGATSPDDVYTEMSGTSMASPTAAGICCVLGEYFAKTRGRRPFSPELKAVVIHTATDAGPAGPDPVFGWGSINAFRAGEVISGQHGDVIMFENIRNGETKSFGFQGGTSPVRATLVWLDPAAAPNTGLLDDDTPVLQNDLDLVLRGPGGTSFHPYRLVRSGTDWVAQANAANHVDNVEVVDAPAREGTWSVEVSASVFQQGDQQGFALVVSGLSQS